MERFNSQIRIYDVVDGSFKEVIKATHRNLREVYEWFDVVKEVNPQVTNCNIQFRFNNLNGSLAPFKSGYNLHKIMRG